MTTVDMAASVVATVEAEAPEVLEEIVVVAVAVAAEAAEVVEAETSLRSKKTQMLIVARATEEVQRM